MDILSSKVSNSQLPAASPVYAVSLINLASHLKAAAAGLLINQTRSFVLAALGRIRVGNVVLKQEVTGETRSFGSPGTMTATLIIRNDNVWWRVAFDSSIGFAESYMLGEVDCSDLETFLEFDVFPLVEIIRMGKTIKPPVCIALEYMTYSCPIWLPKNNKNVKIDSLEKAQLRKLHDVISQAKIKQTDHVLEIGTGWGSFAIEAVRLAGCRVTSLTLSAEQKSEAEARVKAAGLDQNITILLQDYRALSKSGQIFDKVVSIEMLEHVGKDHLVGYFSIIHEVLKKEGGIAVLQSSTMPETRYETYNEGNDFIRKYIFPGAHLPTVTKILEAAQAGSNASLVPDRFINLGGHYSRCLREWRSNFIANFDCIIAPDMVSRNKGITSFALKQFERKFIFYFAMCEAGFKTKTLGNALITLAREGAVETLEHIDL